MYSLNWSNMNSFLKVLFSGWGKPFLSLYLIPWIEGTLPSVFWVYIFIPFCDHNNLVLSSGLVFFFSGDCNSRRRVNTEIANQDSIAGISRMRFVCTTLGSAALICNNTETECKRWSRIHETRIKLYTKKFNTFCTSFSFVSFFYSLSPRRLDPLI